MKQSQISFGNRTKRTRLAEDSDAPQSSQVSSLAGQTEPRSVDSDQVRGSPKDAAGAVEPGEIAAPTLDAGERGLSINGDSSQHASSSSADAVSTSHVSNVQSSFGTASFAGSQRIVRKGQKMVTNSDEDDDSSSSSSLDDLDKLLGAKRPQQQPEQIKPLPSAQQADVGGDSARRPKRRMKQASKQRPPSPNVKKPEYKYSLAFLVEQHKKHERSDEAVSKTNAMLEAANDSSDKKGQVSEMSIDNIIRDREDDDDDDAAEQLKSALRRTEALETRYSWSFFEPQGIEEQPSSLDFPHIRDKSISCLTRDISTRHQTFLSGFLGEYFKKRTMEDDLLAWLLREVARECRDDLRAAYVSVLTDVAERNSASITTEKLKGMFMSVGAKHEALDLQAPISLTKVQQRQNDHHAMPQLLSIFVLLRGLSDNIDDEVRLHALELLCRLLLDQSVTADCRLTLEIGSTIANLIEHASETADREVKALPYSRISHLTDLPKLPRTIQQVCSTLQDPSLRLELLLHLPATTRGVANFRRGLALAFCGSQNSQGEDQSTALKAVADLLDQISFNVDNPVDYTKLTASIAILNIFADSGDPPLFTSNQDEAEFNRCVDLVAAKLRDLAAQIIEKGPLHMGRTETREVIDSFIRRLSYSVRTEPPPKQTLLRNTLNDHNSERMAMKGWIQSGKGEQSHASPGPSAINE